MYLMQTVLATISITAHVLSCLVRSHANSVHIFPASRSLSPYCAFLVFVLALSPATISPVSAHELAITSWAPDTPVQCASTFITWHGGQAPYTLWILSDGTARGWYSNIPGHSYPWNANLPAGTVVSFAISDSTNEHTSSSKNVTIQRRAVEDGGCIQARATGAVRRGPPGGWGDWGGASETPPFDGRPFRSRPNGGFDWPSGSTVTVMQTKTSAMTGTNTNEPSVSIVVQTKDKPSLSTGAIAGIAVGGGLAVLAVGGLSALLLLRRKRTPSERSTPDGDDTVA
ncbi:hypothetical protein C8Q76DRAFT_115192 [Earliella scabrosa]|nr:hypothetical protein C8Q76DRAFT_115192 [Earliella scabrosa]